VLDGGAHRCEAGCEHHELRAHAGISLFLKKIIAEKLTW
jgi:hypothetical protein